MSYRPRAAAIIIKISLDSNSIPIGCLSLELMVTQVALGFAHTGSITYDKEFIWILLQNGPCSYSNTITNIY